MECTEPVAVYYLSSGQLGVPVLDALSTDRRIRLLGVGTQPDRPSGRHRRLEPTPVGNHAQSLGVSADRVVSVNAAAFLSELSRRRPEVVVVAAFGQILKPPLLALPRYGCLNVHASLLPRHRGAAPVSAAILAGDRQTGITFMQMDEGLDTGPVYRTITTAIGETETAEHLTCRLASLAATAVVDCIWHVARAGLRPSPQAKEGSTYARRLSKDDGRIDWSCSAEHVARQVRALAPWPGAFTTLADASAARRLQITAAAVDHAAAHAAPPGSVLQADAAGWVVACGEGCLRLLRVKLAGGGEMAAAVFLRGRRVTAGIRLGVANEGEG